MRAAQHRGTAPVPPDAHVVFILHGYGKSRVKGHRMSFGFTWLSHLLVPELKSSCFLIPVAWPANPLNVASMATFGLVDQASRDAGLALARFIRHSLKGRRISFVAQSLGNRVALEAALHLHRYGLSVDSFVSCAGAVEDSCFSERSLYLNQTRGLRQIHVLHSYTDRVLQGLYGTAGRLQVRRLATKTRGRRSSRGRHPPALGIAGVPHLQWTPPFNTASTPSLTHQKIDRGGHAAYMPQRLPYEHWKSQDSLRAHLRSELDNSDKSTMQRMYTALYTAYALMGRAPELDIQGTADALRQWL